MASDARLTSRSQDLLLGELKSLSVGQERILAELAGLRVAQRRLEEALRRGQDVAGVGVAASRDRSPRTRTTTPGQSASLGSRPQPSQSRPSNVAESVFSLEKVVDEQDAGGSDAESVDSFRPVPARMIAPSLPLGWPGSLALREGFAEATRLSEEDFRELDATSLQDATLGSRGRMTKDLAPPLTTQKSWEPRRQWVLHPNGTARCVADLVSLVVLITDLTMTPYILAFDVRLEGAIMAIAWCATCFWTADLALNFVTGFHQDGELEMRHSVIVRRYFSGFFALDATMVCCDYLSISLTLLTERSSGLLRFVKISRVFRLVGLIRVIRLVKISEDMIDRFFSASGAQLLLKVVAILAVVLWLNHIVGCLWYAVSHVMPSDTGASWTDQLFEEGSGSFSDLQAPYLYATSFHWAMAQMTLGSIGVSATNTAERIFNILLLLAGVLLSASLVSSLSATMVGFEMQMSEQNTLLCVLRQYLRQNKVESSLAIRVRQQTESRVKRPKMLKDEDVLALRLLSASLHTELRFEIYKPILLRHRLFSIWCNLDAGIVRDLCSDSVDFHFLQPNDDLFVAGSSGNEAWVLCQGRLRYAQFPDSSPVVDPVSVPVLEGTCLSEAALWTRWVHVGTAEARVSSQMLSVHADRLHHLLARHPFIKDLTLDYCRQFHLNLALATPPRAYPTDLEIPGCSFGDILMGMPHRMQVTIGVDALRQASLNSTRRMQCAIRLMKAQLMDGVCVLFLNGSGELEHLVPVTVIRLERDDGCVLTQLGKLEDNERRPAVLLPGSKRALGETHSDAIHRILHTKLAALRDHLEVSMIERSSDKESHLEQGTRTTWHRTTFSAKLVSVYDLPIHKCRSVRRQQVRRGTADFFDSSFASLEVLALPHGDQVICYAWLSPVELTHLVKHENERLVQTWLSSLDVDPDGLLAHERRIVALAQGVAVPSVSRDKVTAPGSISR